MANPGYDRISRWIESRIGKLDPADPNMATKLQNLVSAEKSKFPSARGKLVFTRSGNDTIITGDSKPFKGRLKSLGGQYDGKRRAWVVKGKVLTENDVDTPSEVAGLKRYIETMPYRMKLGK